MTANLTGEGLSLGIFTTKSHEMVEFYRDVIGLKLVREVEGSIGTVRFFSVGTSMLKLVEPRDSGSYDRPNPDRPGYFLTLRVRNLGEVLEECRRAGVQVKVEKSSKPTNDGWYGMVVDPDGNLVEFVHDS